MSYSIFISHATTDTKIANVVNTVINNAFEGDILTYLAHGEIRAGEDWKKMIKDNLKNCDAIISIITPQSIKRPWLFIEWSAFWLADKKWYLLLTDEIKISDLIQPMQDRQTTNMLDETSVKVLFRGLAQDSGHSAVPFKFVDLFIDAIKDAINQQSQETADHSYGKYRENLLNLPENDHEKVKIAEYFYQRGEFNIYQNIVREIVSDFTKTKIGIELAKKGDLENLLIISEFIRSAENLGVIAITLVEQGYLDSSPLKKILENISTKNQAELRKVGIRLAELGKEDTDTFSYICDVMTNIAELRKIVFHFVENNNVDNLIFDDLIDKLSETNRAELRKVAIEFILNGLYHSNKFYLVLQLLSGNQRETEKVMRKLFEVDLEMFDKLLENEIIIHIATKDRLKEMRANFLRTDRK